MAAVAAPLDPHFDSYARICRSTRFADVELGGDLAVSQRIVPHVSQYRELGLCAVVSELLLKCLNTLDLIPLDSAPHHPMF